MSERQGGFGCEIDDDGKERPAVQVIVLQVQPSSAESDAVDPVNVAAAKVKK